MIQFFVPGQPGTKGSARAFVVRGRAIITNDSRKAKPWAAAVSAAAHEAMGGNPPMQGPVRVSLCFYLPRPKSHYLRGQLRTDAPAYCPKRPDLDKLTRCTWDALTGIVFSDDAQVVLEYGSKLYANGPVGCEISIFEAAP